MLLQKMVVNVARSLGGGHGILEFKRSFGPSLLVSVDNVIYINLQCLMKRTAHLFIRMAKKKHRVPGPKLIEQLMKLYSQRVGELLEMWFATTLHREEFDQVFSFCLRQFLHEPVHFLIEMKQIRLFESDKLAIPLRECTKKELRCIHNLLNLHRQAKLFQVDVGFEGYSIRYSKCKYNAILIQHLDRLDWVKHLCLMIQKMFVKETQQQQCWHFMKEHLEESLERFSCKNHPLRKQVQKWIRKTDRRGKN